MTLRYFTDGTWRPCLREIQEIPTPVGAHCLACGHAIQADDCGVSMMHSDARGDAYRPWHLTCFQQALGVVERASA